MGTETVSTDMLRCRIYSTADGPLLILDTPAKKYEDYGIMPSETPEEITDSAEKIKNLLTTYRKDPRTKVWGEYKLPTHIRTLLT